MHYAAIEAARRRSPAPRIQVQEGLNFDKHLLASLVSQFMWQW